MKGDISIDERGKVSFVNDFDFKDVKRFYVVENRNKNFRGWHGHKKEAKYVYVVSGDILLHWVGLSDDEVKSKVLSAQKPEVQYIPPNHANGFKALTDDARVIFFSTSTLEESLKDDLRFPEGHWTP